MKEGLSDLQSSFMWSWLTRGAASVVTEFGSSDFNSGLFGAIRYSRKEGEKCVVADFGCGVGNAIGDISNKIRRECSDLVYECIGIDENPLPAYRTNGLKNDPNLKFIKSNLEDIELPDNCVDFGYSYAVIMYVRDKLRALEEIYRVLKPGGVALVDLGPSFTYYPLLDEIISSSTDFSIIFNIYRNGMLCISKPGGDIVFNGFGYNMDSSYRAYSGVLCTSYSGPLSTPSGLKSSYIFAGDVFPKIYP